MGLPKLQITRGRRRQPAQANNILQHDPIVSITLTSACIKHLPPTDRTNTLVIAPYTTKLSATDALSGIDSHPILELYQHIQPQSGDKSSTRRWGRQTTVPTQACSMAKIVSTTLTLTRITHMTPNFVVHCTQPRYRAKRPLFAQGSSHAASD